MSKEAYYFSHDSNAQRDPKIIKLRKEMGWEGYGLFWAIVEMLREQSDFKMRTDYDVIAFALQTDTERIKALVENYDLFEVNETHFWSESLNERMVKKAKKAQQAREAALEKWRKHADAERTQSERNAIKGKGKGESKGNKNERVLPDSVNEVVEEFKKRKIKYPQKNAQKFYDYYEEREWTYKSSDKKRAPIKNWKRCISQWDLKKEKIPL